MKFQLTQDYHIHSYLSSCSRDEEENAARILKYAKDNNYDSICITDHFWDETVPGASKWYMPQNLPHIKEILPLPEDEEGKVKFFFGCETDMDKYGTIGISHKTAEEMAFIIVPTTHLHMTGFTIDESIGGGEDESFVKARTELYVSRFQKLLDSDMPFEKTGIAHLSCGLICKNPAGSKSHLKVMAGVSDETYRELFEQSAKKGLAIELNFNSFAFEGDELEAMVRPYRIAQTCGCKFYFGSDAHHPQNLDNALKNFTHIADILNLQEEQKFSLV